MKRLDGERKSIAEQRNIRTKEYGKYIRDYKSSKKQINPIFTGRPHYDVPIPVKRMEEKSQEGILWNL